MSRKRRLRRGDRVRLAGGQYRGECGVVVGAQGVMLTVRLDIGKTLNVSPSTLARIVEAPA